MKRVITSAHFNHIRGEGKARSRAVMGDPSQSRSAPAPPEGEPFGKPSFTFVCVRLISASPLGRGGGVADGEGEGWR